MADHPAHVTHIDLKKWIGITLIIAITLFLWLVPSSFFGIDDMTVSQQRTIAIFVFTALMWMFELIPTWTTSVVAIVFMLLTISNKGIGFLVQGEVGKLVNYKSIMAAFADPVIMLFLGGFVLASVATKVNLDVQLAKVLLKPFGTKPKYVLLGFLLVIGVFSMFMSNTATAAMMLTFLAPVLATLPADGKGRIALVLAIPIAANIGGMGTPIGTPPNAIALGALADAGYEISFAQWMLRMVPFVLLMLFISWFILLKMFPFKATKIELKIEPEDNHVKPWQKYVVWVTFAVTIILWVGEGFFKINSNVVALIPFAVLSATGVFTAKDLSALNWSVLWMVAGGFALGTCLNETGLARLLIESIPFREWNIFIVLIISGLVCYFLSNFISNSASANLVVPILIIVGSAMSVAEETKQAFESIGGITTLIIGIAISASVAMCLPVSTPPNALAHSTGMINSKDMSKVGLLLGAIGFVLGYMLLIFIGF